MKGFVFGYPGLWLGGKAVVIADNKDEAIKLLQNDGFSIPRPRKKDIKLTAELELNKPRVIYNDNGDY